MRRVGAAVEKNTNDVMDDFYGMNQVYATMFKGHRPARTTVSVKQNPLDALVEIECIAVIKNDAV